MSIADKIGKMIDRIQSVSRFRRKPKPVYLIDIEVRDADGKALTVCGMKDYQKEALKVFEDMPSDRILFP